MKTTITEALASLKLTQKKLDQKGQFIAQYLYRQNAFKDPMLNEGGSEKVIKSERQSINDLSNGIIALRKAINLANDTTFIEIQGVNRSISEWIIWRREISKKQEAILGAWAAGIRTARSTAQQKGLSVVTAEKDSISVNDLIINISEVELQKDIESLQSTLGVLDGLLSLKNATTFVEVL
jgi:hypothetical protein